MKASPPPSYTVAMEQNQLTPTTADSVEPPSYQETNGTDEIQPIDNNTAQQITTTTTTTTPQQNASRGS